ncbi:MAG: glycerol-3-phosphate 1-O-acyltransferase PlsY [Nitrospinales bacterium]
MIASLVWILAYILGSLPFGAWFARSRNIDIQKHGSGNIGATNVARTLGKKAGLLVLLADCFKGFISVVIADQILGSEFEVGVAGLMAFLGHIYSIFLKFKGGKGVATGLGVFLFIMPFATLSAIGVFALVLCLTKYISLSSISAALSIPLFGLLFNTPQSYIFISVIISVIVTLKHKDNIERLIVGKESKFLRK